MGATAFGAFAAYQYSQKDQEESVMPVFANTTAFADSEGLKRVEIVDSHTIEEGQMKEIAVGEGKSDKVLISRFNGKLYAIGAYCSHFGFPLAKGMLFDDKVLCPLHAAGFSVVTGAAENAPGLDSLPKYEIVEEGKRFYVIVPEKLEQKRTLPITKRDPNDKRNFVVIGGGAAGLNCVETLRYSGYTGKITFICKEKVLPYDRTLLTKTLPFGDPSKFELRNKEWLSNADIDVVHDSVYSVHPDTKQIAMARGAAISYDKLCIATGTEVNKPPIPGSDAHFVYYIRTNEDQIKIKERCAEVK